MGQHQKHIKDLETDSGHREEVDGDQLLGVILQKCAPGLRRRLAAAHHVFADAALTDVDAELSSSPWMRGAPQPGFSRHILRIKSRTSREMTGRPGWPRRTFQVQNKRKPARCQATTVSGLTMASAERQSRQRRDRQIHNSGPLRSISGVFLRISEARRFGGAEPSSRARGQHANGRSRTELRGVS